MTHTVLIANRGEIAARIARTARGLGLRTVAVFSDADVDAPHVHAADVAVRIGPAPVGESYLDPERLLDAAHRTGATLVHPGYGFLSENADFARAVTQAGLTWVGPATAAIDAMGDKARAKRRMRQAGVPVVPGFEAEDPSEDELMVAAAEVGFPLLVKATAGGGGRGMRRVDRVDDLVDAIRSARSEAASAFGSGRVLLERFVEHARHVEVQFLADVHGHVIHLAERDCSVQRRHQKVVEEAPGPRIDPGLRARMGQAACAAAAAVDYVGAGTVEFLLDAADGSSFYFLEMNTRLQVEHPVTELVTGLDLVELQLRVALGEPLPLTQDDLRLDGHAIEVRLYAEEPAQHFAPRTGALVAFSVPALPGVRVDAGVGGSAVISSHYDPMIAKIIAHGSTRDVARRRLRRALTDTVTLGLPTNRRFLDRVLGHPTFAEGRATTRFLDHDTSLLDESDLEPDTVVVAAALLAAGHGTWLGWRNAHPPSQPVVLDIDGTAHTVTLNEQCYVYEGTCHRVNLLSDHTDVDGLRTLRIEVDGVVRTARARHDGATWWLQHATDEVAVRLWDPTPSAASTASDGVVRAPSAGRVLQVSAAVGDAVVPGDALVLVEAMKIETRLVAEVAGLVEQVLVAPGQTVRGGQTVVIIEPAEELPS